MDYTEYQPVNKESAEVDDGGRQYYQDKNNNDYRRFGRLPGVLLLAICISLNTILFFMLVSKQQQQQSTNSGGFNYAGLSMNKQVILVHDNRTLDDPVWYDARHNEYIGMVALDEKFIKDNGLLPAQRYPWSPDKSLYVLHAFHSMHCVKVLRDTIVQARDGREWSNPIGHITHCLHTLREDVECFADDFPRYTGRLNTQVEVEVTTPGDGAIRMCRDWDQLLDFAIENTACWNQNHSLAGEPLIEDYKDCPDGSKPWEKFGF